jgi:DNA-binding transcriptional LysR family regulator
VWSELELRDLALVIAVADGGTIAHASDRLGISASPLSRQVRRIERQTGLVLFERRAQRLHLTAAGRRFVDEARNVLAAAERLAEQVRAETGQAPTTLAVGCVDSALHAGLLTRGVRSTTRRFPSISTEVVLARSTEQIGLLRRGEIDVALVHTPPRDDRMLDHTLVLDDRLVLLAPASSPLGADSSKAVAPASLDGQPWIIDAQPSSTASVERFLARAGVLGFVPDIRYRVADLAARVALVAAGLGYSLLPRSAVATLATDPQDVTALELPWLGLTLQVYAVTIRRPARAAAEFVATFTRAGNAAGTTR